jgi:hypothetical protein
MKGRARAAIPSGTILRLAGRGLANAPEHSAHEARGTDILRYLRSVGLVDGEKVLAQIARNIAVILHIREFGDSAGVLHRVRL